MKLKNSYSELPDRFYELTRPEVFEDAELVLFNAPLAEELGLELDSDADLARIFSGRDLLPGSKPLAQAYAGFQFGHRVKQLGDGRAHLLGELEGFDIQLKGSGRTRFSRGGDGRSPLGAVIREFLVSEGMHALGIPTTRSLCIVATNERVMRQYGPEPGGILTRVAESHLRVGTFQYFSFKKDDEALATLVDYTIGRHYPEIKSDSLADRCLELLRQFADRQGDLVAKWYGVGFIHGVMNTDNCSIPGVTIDYGPCAFMDEFRSMKVFSSIDEGGRYAYGNQMAILEWNILRLADCLLPLISDDREAAVAKVTEALQDTISSFADRIFREFGKKLGLAESSQADEPLISSFLRYLEEESLDFTVSFAHLPELLGGEKKSYVTSSKLDEFVKQWGDRNPDVELIRRTNPKVIPRNHQIENVIGRANQGDYAPIQEMWDAIKSPFEVAPEHEKFAEPPEPRERVQQTFCGT